MCFELLSFGVGYDLQWLAVLLPHATQVRRPGLYAAYDAVLSLIEIGIHARTLITHHLVIGVILCKGILENGAAVSAEAVKVVQLAFTQKVSHKEDVWVGMYELQLLARDYRCSCVEEALDAVRELLWRHHSAASAAHFFDSREKSCSYCSYCSTGVSVVKSLRVFKVGVPICKKINFTWILDFVISLAE